MEQVTTEKNSTKIVLSSGWHNTVLIHKKSLFMFFINIKKEKIKFFKNPISPQKISCGY